MLDNNYLLIGAAFIVICIFFITLFNINKNKLRDTKNALTDLETQYNTVTEEKNRLEQDIARNIEAITGISTRLTERDQQINSLTENLKNDKLEITTLQNKNAELREQSSGIFSRGQLLQQQVNELQTISKTRENELKDINAKYVLVFNEFTALKSELTEKQNSFLQQQQTFDQTKQELTNEFQRLASQILEEKGKIFSQTSHSSLTSLLQPFKEQIDSFQKRFNAVHTESVQGRTALETEIRKLSEFSTKISKDAHNLTAALKGDKKLLGNWGETQLEKSLQLVGLEPGFHYKAQERFRDEHGTSFVPDFIVMLPDQKHIVIDSKVSLIAYDSAIANGDNEEEQQQLLTAHTKAIRNHIDELSKKDYSNLIKLDSPSFVLMFIPIEPAYIAALKHDPDLFNYAYKKNIILVSHTTLIPILTTVANLWRLATGNKEAQEISKRAGDIYNQVCIVAERLAKLGNSLTTVTKQYNDTVTGLSGQQGLYGKVERFKTLSNVANKSLPHMTPLHNDVNLEKLDISNNLTQDD